MIGIDISGGNSIGDKVQFASLPENYFRTFNQKLVDVNKEWIFDYNPFVVRDVAPASIWNLWAFPRPQSPYRIWRSLAERNASYLDANVFIRYPRLYRFEDNKKSEIVIHTTGKTCGPMQDYILDFLRKKYPEAIQIGAKEDVSIGLNDYRGLDIWETIEIISKARLFIGVDSGPSLIATAYPECWVKKILVNKTYYQLEKLVPMADWDPNSHWYDNSFSLYNCFNQDVGSTYSYMKL